MGITIHIMVFWLYGLFDKEILKSLNYGKSHICLIRANALLLGMIGCGIPTSTALQRLKIKERREK
jgi:hypothetical protein